MEKYRHEKDLNVGRKPKYGKTMRTVCFSLPDEVYRDVKEALGRDWQDWARGLIIARLPELKQAQN